MREKKNTSGQMPPSATDLYLSEGIRSDNRIGLLHKAMNKGEHMFKKLHV